MRRLVTTLSFAILIASPALAQGLPPAVSTEASKATTNAIQQQTDAARKANQEAADKAQTAPTPAPAPATPGKDKPATPPAAR